MGLGPERVEDLGLLKENVGLKQGVIILDYPSPQQGQTSGFGAVLYDEEIERARRKCSSELRERRPDKEQHISVVQSNNLEYFVQMAEEDEGENTNVGNEKALDGNNMIQLAAGFSRALSLKRRVITTEEGDNLIEETRSFKRVCTNQAGRTSVDFSTTVLLKAEEAGHPMPPRAP